MLWVYMTIASQSLRNFFCCCCSSAKVEEGPDEYSSLDGNSSTNYGTTDESKRASRSQSPPNPRPKTVSTHRQAAISHHIEGRLIETGMLTRVDKPDWQEIFDFFNGKTVRLVLTKKEDSERGFWTGDLDFTRIVETGSNIKTQLLFEMDKTTPETSPYFLNGGFSVTLNNNPESLKATASLVKRKLDPSKAANKGSQESKEKEAADANATANSRTPEIISNVEQRYYQLQPGAIKRPLCETYKRFGVFTDNTGQYVLSASSRIGDNVFGKQNQLSKYKFVQIQKKPSETEE
jgi:hypothetical protein